MAYLIERLVRDVTLGTVPVGKDSVLEASRLSSSARRNEVRQSKGEKAGKEASVIPGNKKQR